jgi:hypothetical protein
MFRLLELPTKTIDIGSNIYENTSKTRKYYLNARIDPSEEGKKHFYQCSSCSEK